MGKNRFISKYESLSVQVRASLWFLICSFLQKGISTVTTPIFTRIMSEAEYGQFGVFSSWYSIISIISALSLTGGVHQQGLVKYDQDRKIFSSSLQGLSTTLIVCWLVIYLALRNTWNNLLTLSTTEMLCMFIIIWTTAVFGFWANEQRVVYSYRTLVSVTLTVSVLKPVLEIFLVLNSENLLHTDATSQARVIGWAAADIIAFGWMFIYQLKRGKAFFSKKYWLYALGFNLPLVPHYLSQTVLNSADRIMIKRMIGLSEAGLYNLAYQLSLIMTLFNTALMQTLSPWIYQKIKDHKGKDVAPLAYATLVMIGAINLLLILLAPEAVRIFAPVKYHEAVWVIPPVAMSVFFMYAYDLFAKFAFYYEKTKIIMCASVVGAVLNVVLNYYFMKKWGYIAAGYTTLVCYLVYAVAHYVIMRKVCREKCGGEYPYETKTIVMIAVPFLIAGFAFLATYNHPVIRYSLVVAALIMMFIFRNQIIRTVKQVMNVKKNKNA